MKTSNFDSPQKILNKKPNFFYRKAKFNRFYSRNGNFMHLMEVELPLEPCLQME